MSHQLEDFIYKHGEELLRLAYTYVKKHDVAEDIVQDVLLKAYEQRSQFLGNASYKTYLYRMTINRCYDYFRSWSYRNTVLTDQLSKIMKKPQQSFQKENENSTHVLYPYDFFIYPYKKFFYPYIFKIYPYLLLFEHPALLS